MSDNKKKQFYSAVSQVQSKKIDPKHVSKDVVKAARTTTRAAAQKFATTDGTPRKVHRKVNKESLVQKENIDAMSVISAYNGYGKALKQTENLMNIGTKIDEIVNMAEQVVLSEAGDWFDEFTIKRNIKEIKAYSKDFLKTTTEAQRMIERAQALYDDIGTRLDRYFELAEPTVVEAQDGYGVGDDESVLNLKKPKTFDVVNMKEESPVSVGSEEIPSTPTSLNNSDREDAFRKIARTRIASRIEGETVDRFSADIVCKVLDRLKNKDQLLSLPISSLIKMAFRLAVLKNLIR